MAAQQHKDFVTIQVTLRIPPTILLNNAAGTPRFVIEFTPDRQEHHQEALATAAAQATTNNVLTTITIHIPLAISESGQANPAAAAAEKNANPHQEQRVRAEEDQEQHEDLFDDEYLSLVNEFNDIVGPDMEDHSADAEMDGNDLSAGSFYRQPYPWQP